MSENVEVPGVLWPQEAGILGEIVLRLVENNKLPSDFEFRLLALDEPERLKVATEDILAALDMGGGSGYDYLTQDLPDCVSLSGFFPLRPVLEKVETDYHILRDLLQIAADEGVESYIACNAWDMYVNYLDPDLHSKIHAIFNFELGRMPTGHSREYQYRVMLGRVAIKDQALFAIYQNPDAIHKHGPLRRKLLHFLLLDNRPELGPDPS